MQKISYLMLGILQRYAPTGVEQRELSEMYAEMQRDGLTEDQIVAGFAGALVDGLTDGNWPWVIKAMRLPEPPE